MTTDKFLTNSEFAGIIDGEEKTSSTEDTKNRGRYKVLIPELMYSCYDDEQAPIFCTNQATKYRNGYCNVGSGIYGQYFPLHPGTKVVVKFYSEDYESGYIDRIIGDYHNDSLPLELPSKDRDQYYQLLRTINDDLIAVTANTTSDKVPANGIHIYHKKDNVVLIFDENGVHVYSKKDLDFQIDSKAYIKVNNQVDLLFNGVLNLKVGGSCNIQASGNCNIDAPMIKLNCGNKVSINSREKAKTITLDKKKTPNVEF